MTAGEKLALQLTPTASIKQAETALWKANDFGDSLYTSSIGLASKLSDRIQLAIDLLDTYKTRPATAATKKNDVANAEKAYLKCKAETGTFSCGSSGWGVSSSCKRDLSLCGP